MKFQPHAYEKSGIQGVIANATYGLFWDPGLGKTVTMESAFEILRKKGIVSTMLVIAPLRVCHSVWPREAEKWDHLAHLKVAVLHGPHKDERLSEPADVYVINPEGLDWLARAVVKHYKRWPFDVLCVDESTKFKHTQTQRFKTLRPMLPMFKRRYILTGSPAPNGLIDLFGQVYILDLGNALGRFVTHYRNSYFDNPDAQGWRWVPRQGAQEEIYKKLKPLVLRLAAKDHLDLPELVENIVEVELPPAAMRQYKQMEEILLTVLESDETITAANASVAWGKCRQIANGGLFHEGGEKWSHIHKAKVEAVEDLVEELSGKPALVAYEYRHDLDRFRRSLMFKDAPYIGGGVTTSEFRKIECAWNAGEIPVLFAQPQSVAHGLNLQGTNAAVIDAALTPDLEVDEQFVRRVWRQGQKETVFRHRLVAKGTVDEVIIKMLRSKERTQSALLDALKSHLKTGRRAA